MGNTAIALTFVMFVNMLMFLGQAAILDLNPDNANQFYNYEGSILSEFDSAQNASNPILNQSHYDKSLPGGSGTLEISGGNILTDTFTSIKNWIVDKLGLTYVRQILAAPYNMLAAMQLPQAYVFAVGSIWYGITLFLIVSFMLGRE